MILTGCKAPACFVKVVAFSRLAAPVDATYRGLHWPNRPVFELTPECVNAALLSQSCQGPSVATMLGHWRERYLICN